MNHGMSRYLRASLFDFIAVAVLSVALGYAVFSGFDSTLALRHDFVLEGAFVSAVLAVLYAGGWSRRARIFSTVGTVVFVLAAVTVAMALAPEGVPVFEGGAVNDVEGNYVIFVVVLSVCAILSYALSRTLGGTVVLVVAACMTCGIVQFLFRGWAQDEGGMFVFIAVLLSSVMLIVYRRYRAGLAKAEVQEGVAFGRAAVLGITAGGVSLLAATLCYGAIIAPLGLSTPVLKPFEHYIVPPVVEYSGTYDEYLVEDPDRHTSLLNEKEDETTQNAAGGSVPDQETVESSQSPIITFLQSLSIFSEDDWDESFDAVTYDQLRLGFLVAVLLVLLAIAAIVALRIRQRDFRLFRLRNMDSAAQVIYLYNFLLSRFKKLGLGKPDASTPLEFAYDSRRNLVPFTRGTGQIDFVGVTLAYQRAAYGSGEVTDEDCERVRRYYRAFFANAHRYVGTPKWLLKFWTV